MITPNNRGSPVSSHRPTTTRAATATTIMNGEI